LENKQELAEAVPSKDFSLYALIQLSCPAYVTGLSNLIIL
jgi:hypothetical protein